MDGGGRRQLPSWMMKSTAIEQASIPGTKGENKEDGFVEILTKAVKSRKKVQAKIDDTGIPSNENKSQLLKEGQARTRKRKSNKLEKVEGERIHEDEKLLLKPCKENRRGNRAGDFRQGDEEKKVDRIKRKRVRENAPTKKHSRKVEEFHNASAESCSSEDELTVDDLISIAEEYVKADREKEFQKSKNLETEPVKKVKKPLPRAESSVGSEKDLTSHSVTRVTDQPLLSDSSSTKPLAVEGSIIDQSITFDPARDMLELFLGPLLRKTKEGEMKMDSITEKTKLDYEFSNRSENDNDKGAPEMKKKFSLKDNVGKLLD
ncbi:Uncharacterized protein RDABS01_022344 [Bienertia sinuspersici]